jgi:hypothetical protein
MKELELTPLVKTGRNMLAIRLVLPGTTSGILDHIKLLGSFGVSGNDDAGYSLTTAATEIDPRSWTEQGYPFFSGCGVYHTTFELSADDAQGKVMVEIPMVDDVVEVVVNGEEAGVRLWDPYVVDISAHVHSGANDLALRVANTPANLLNGVLRPSGLAGAPRIVVVPSLASSASTSVGSPTW